MFLFKAECPDDDVFCKKLTSDPTFVEFSTLIEDDLSQNDYLFVPDALIPTGLTDRKKRDINRALRYNNISFNFSKLLF